MVAYGHEPTKKILSVVTSRRLAGGKLSLQTVLGWSEEL